GPDAARPQRARHALDRRDRRDRRQRRTARAEPEAHTATRPPPQPIPSRHRPAAKRDSDALARTGRSGSDLSHAAGDGLRPDRRPDRLPAQDLRGHQPDLVQGPQLHPELDGPEVALAAVDRLEDKLASYHAYHATRADLLRRLDRGDQSRAAYGKAIELAGNTAEIAYLTRRRDQLV